MTEPVIGSKPAPDQSDVQAAQRAKLATELTLKEYYTKCLAKGVESITFAKAEGGDRITLKGRINGVLCEAIQIAPLGQPFALYAMICLEQFNQGVLENFGTYPGTIDHISVEGVVHTTPEPKAGAFLEKVKSNIAAKNNPLDRLPPEPEPIKCKCVPLTPAGTPKPKGICKNGICPQPVAYLGGEFCGGNCAQQYHLDQAAKRQGVKVPK